MTLKVNNDISQLKKLIVHRPDKGIGMVTPDQAVDLLYEDIVYLPKMQKEHDLFTKAIAAFIGKDNVMDIQDMLQEVLEDSVIKNNIIKEVATFENIDSALLENAKTLSETLITGISEDQLIMPPLPNLIFTRDVGVMINDYLLISNPNKRARKREAIICKYAFLYHPIFKEQKHKYIQLEGEDATIEGGDVMVFDEKHVIIGCSERTLENGIEQTKQQLFQNNVIENVIKIDIPKLRYCMHFDTVFTRISENECVVYAPLILEDTLLNVTKYSIDGSEKNYHSLKELILEMYPNMEFIPCGNGVPPHDAREQWTDGCNLFTVKEGVAFSYDRNFETEKAFKKRGYRIISASDLLQEFAYMNLKPEEVEKTIITIPSSELSRARGGSHCLTMPIERA